MNKYVQGRPRKYLTWLGRPGARLQAWCSISRESDDPFVAYDSCKRRGQEGRSYYEQMFLKIIKKLSYQFGVGTKLKLVQLYA